MIQPDYNFSLTFLRSAAACRFLLSTVLGQYTYLVISYLIRVEFSLQLRLRSIYESRKDERDRKLEPRRAKSTGDKRMRAPNNVPLRLDTFVARCRASPHMDGGNTCMHLLIPFPSNLFKAGGRVQDFGCCPTLLRNRSLCHNLGSKTNFVLFANILS
jgi:hypothetical protein